MSSVQEIQRLLIIRNDRVGDLVLTLPTFEYCRRVFPAARIHALVAAQTADLLEGNRNIDVLIRDDRRLSFGQLALSLSKAQFDAALVIHTNTRNCLAVWYAGIPRRVTWGRKPIGWLTGNRRVALRRSHPPIHESQFALAFARRLTDNRDLLLPPPSLEIAPATVAQIRHRLRDDLGDQRPLFGVHPGGYNSSYNWPRDHYCQLVNELARLGCVVVTGGPREQELLAGIREQVPLPLRRRVAFYCDLRLMELAAAISLVDVLTVSNTGPMHLGGIMNVPTVALFSGHPAQSPSKWAPFGGSTVILQPPLREGQPGDIPAHQALAHMSQITVQQVLQANLRQLETVRGRRAVHALAS